MRRPRNRLGERERGEVRRAGSSEVQGVLMSEFPAAY
jgi:hypothetical protein